MQILNGPTAVNSYGDCIMPLRNREGAEAGENYESEDLPTEFIKMKRW